MDSAAQFLPLTVKFENVDKRNSYTTESILEDTATFLKIFDLEFQSLHKMTKIHGMFFLVKNGVQRVALVPRLDETTFDPATGNGIEIHVGITHIARLLAHEVANVDIT